MAYDWSQWEDPNKALAEVARAGEVYNQAKARGDMATAEAAHRHAQGVRQAAGIPGDGRTVTGLEQTMFDKRNPIQQLAEVRLQTQQPVRETPYFVEMQFDPRNYKVPAFEYKEPQALPGHVITPFARKNQREEWEKDVKLVQDERKFAYDMSSDAYKRRWDEKTYNEKLALGFSDAYGVPVKPMGSLENLWAQVKGLKRVDQQKDDRDFLIDLWDRLGIAPEGIPGVKAGTAKYDSNAGKENTDLLFDIWDKTGYAPSGIPGVDEGTPLYDKAEARGGKVDAYSEWTGYFTNKLAGNKGMSLSQMETEIMSNAGQLAQQGYDINDILDALYNSYTGGKYPTKKSYTDSVKQRGKEWTENNPGAVGPPNLSGFNPGQKGGEVKLTGNKNVDRWAEPIQTAASKHGVPAQVLFKMMQAESAGNPNAKSHAGATGLMQFMPATAKGMGINPLDPHQSIDGAARYLKGLHNQFGDWTLAVAAYNAGPGNVKKYGNKVPPFKETQHYIQKVFS